MTAAAYDVNAGNGSGGGGGGAATEEEEEEEKERTGDGEVQRARRSDVKCRRSARRGHRKSRAPNRVLRARANPRDGRKLLTKR